MAIPVARVTPVKDDGYGDLPVAAVPLTESVVAEPLIGGAAEERPEPGSLADKTERIRKELGLPDDGIQQVLHEACRQLAVKESGTLQERADKCLTAINGAPVESQPTQQEPQGSRPPGGDGLQALRYRNQDPTSGCAQFRIGDTFCNDHLDSNDYWLNKDGLSRTEVPAPLQGRCSLETWKELLGAIDRATYSTRCSLGLWCLMGGMAFSPLACIYCKEQTDRLLCKYLKIRDDFQRLTGLEVTLVSFMSHFELEAEAPKPIFMNEHEREKDRGVLIWQINVPKAPRSSVGPRQPFPAPNHVEGCYVGACIVPFLVTGFYVYPMSDTDIVASGFTLCMGWRRQLKRNASERYKYNMLSHDRQEWTYCYGTLCMWGSPGWWAIKVFPGCDRGSRPASW